LTEGIDNDHDERWNEDGPGGVNFNRNFPYGYEFFAPDAGVHQVSEAETRALADFIIEHPNIGIVVTYGAADNLSKTPKGASSTERRKPMTAIDDDDTGYYRAMGESFRKALGLDKELEGASVPGAFSDWMYFHRGRLSLAAKAWSPAIAVELSEAAQKKEKTQEQAKAEE
ncbi:MAG: M14 family zinc carboxypeptidase, partial [Planctomycetota bacterium]